MPAKHYQAQPFTPNSASGMYTQDLHEDNLYHLQNALSVHGVYEAKRGIISHTPWLAGIMDGQHHLMRVEATANGQRADIVQARTRHQGNQLQRSLGEHFLKTSIQLNPIGMSIDARLYPTARQSIGIHVFKHPLDKRQLEQYLTIQNDVYDASTLIYEAFMGDRLLLAEPASKAHMLGIFRKHPLVLRRQIGVELPS